MTFAPRLHHRVVRKAIRGKLGCGLSIYDARRILPLPLHPFIVSCFRFSDVFKDSLSSVPRNTVYVTGIRSSNVTSHSAVLESPECAL